MSHSVQIDYYQEYLRLKKENNNLKRIFKIRRDYSRLFKEKIIFALSFLSFLTYERQKFILPKPGIYGSFVRKIFEFLSDPEKVPKNNCIDFYIGKHILETECKENLLSSCKLEQELRQIINKLDLQLGIFLTTKLEEMRPKFGNFYYEGSNRVQTNESNDSYHLHFIHEDNNHHLEVLLHACLKDFEMDSNVNSINLTTSGMEISNGFNFLNTIDSIFNKKATLSGHSFKQNENKIWNQGLIRNDKVELLSKNINYIKFSCLGLMDSGYLLYGYQIPQISIEKEEDCVITGIKPPYPIITLECNHSISVMAYFGIIYRSENEFTESIRCPICRGNLALKLETNDYRNLLYTPYFDNFINQAKTYKNFRSISRVNFYNICSSESLEEINQKDETLRNLLPELDEVKEDDDDDDDEEEEEESENRNVPIPVEFRNLNLFQQFSQEDVD